MITRRSAMQCLGGVGASLLAVGCDSLDSESKFSIGACDWCVGKRQHIDAFEVGAKIGLEGLQVSFGDPGSDFDLRDAQVRQQYYRRVDETGIQIASLGMGILNQRPLSTDPEAIAWVNDAIDVMATMKQEAADKATSVCLLAFFGKGDINGKPELMDSVIKKLKSIAKKAEDSGVVFGIESLLTADDHLRIIEEVGSPAIQVYYDSANSLRMGYNIYEEVVRIGGQRICEIHCKEDGELIGNGKVDFPKFRDAINQIGYSGWLIIEGSKAKKDDVVEAYSKNFQYLHDLFRVEA